MNGSLAPNPPRRPIRLTVVCEEGTTNCQACGQPIAPGGRATIHDTWPVIVHDPREGGCPAVWTPTVIDGGNDRQLTLPLTPALRLVEPAGPNRQEEHPDDSHTSY